MKLTHNELYKMLSESINQALSEASPQNNTNNGPDIEGNFNQDYVQQNTKNKVLDKPNNNGNQTPNRGTQVKQGVKTAAKAGMTYGGSVLGGAALAAMTGLGTASFFAGQILAGVGITALAANYISNLRAMNNVSKLEFPKNPLNAMKYARYAAAERVSAQEICLNVQQNLKNAMNAWNLQYPNEKYNWETIIQLINNNGGETKAKFQDRGQEQHVDANYDMNFTDKNAGKNESTNKGKLTESNDYDKIVKSVGEFKHYFSLDHDEGLETLVGLGQTYIQSYGLWMKWTRYVNVLVQKFQKYGITWERVISANTKFGVKNTLITFANELFGTQIPLDDKEQQQEYRGNSQGQKIYLRVIDKNYQTNIKYGKYKGSNFILLQQEKTNIYFGVEPLQFEYENNANGGKIGGELYGRKIYDNNNEYTHMVNIIKTPKTGMAYQDVNIGQCPDFKNTDPNEIIHNGMGIEFYYSPNMIAGTTQGSKGEKIYVLRDKAIFNMRVIED